MHLSQKSVFADTLFFRMRAIIRQLRIIARLPLLLLLPTPLSQFDLTHCSTAVSVVLVTSKCNMFNCASVNVTGSSEVETKFQTSKRHWKDVVLGHDIRCSPVSPMPRLAPLNPGSLRSRSRTYQVRPESSSQKPMT